MTKHLTILTGGSRGMGLAMAQQLLQPCHTLISIARNPNPVLTAPAGDAVEQWTLDLADGRIPVIAGTGANATAEAISLTKRFNDSGVVGCLTVTPYYNRPTQEGLFQHLKLSPNILTCRKFCIMCHPVPVAICCRKPLAVWRKLKILSVLRKQQGT